MTERPGHLDSREADLARQAERSLAAGRELLGWWRAAGEEGPCEGRFELAADGGDSDRGYGFFAAASVDGGTVPVMGVVQEHLFDRARFPPGCEGGYGDWLARQVRELVLRHFLRVAARHEPGDQAAPGQGRRGFGYRPLLGRRRGDAVARLAAGVDLRQVGEVWEWVLAQVRIFDFKFTLGLPLAEPHLVLPRLEESPIVIAPDFIVDETRPSPGVLGRYGLGYAFVPEPERRSALAYGPGRFDVALQTFRFDVLEPGEIRVRMVFVVNRPRRLVEMGVNPLDWGLRLADRLAPGLTSRLLGPLRGTLEELAEPGSGIDPVLGALTLAGLPVERIERTFLTRHFLQHSQALAAMLRTWRAVPDWTDPPALPDWIDREGGW